MPPVEENRFRPLAADESVGETPPPMAEPADDDDDKDYEGNEVLQAVEEYGEKIDEQLVQLDKVIADKRASLLKDLHRRETLRQRRTAIQYARSGLTKIANLSNVAMEAKVMRG